MSDHEIAQPKGPHRWQKGQPSPNPKGRPRAGLALAERIRERFDPDTIIDLAARLAADETLSVSSRLAALLPFVQLGYVKPPSGVALDVTTRSIDGPSRFDHLSLDEKRALLAQLRGPRRVQDPKVLDGDAVLSPTTVALSAVVTDDE